MIIQGDCIEEMKKLDDESIDICIFDLPFNQICKSWDKDKINLPEMWKELLRICKKHTPLFFFCTTKFGVNLINTAPKKMPFRYDICWEKSSPVGFLNARRMVLRKHEMIYVFYKHLPLYDLSSHKHKFIKQNKPSDTKDKNIYGKDDEFLRKIERSFTPKLPTSVLKKNIYGQTITNVVTTHQQKYEPKLPTSVLKKDVYGKDTKTWTTIRNSFTSKLPTSVLKKDVYGIKNEDKPDFQKLGRNNKSCYDPPLPTSVKFCKSQRSKLHSTQKPVDLIKWILKYYSKENDVCLDITAGSGSTGLACAEMNRKFILIEKEEKFIDIINERLKKYLQ